MSLSNPIELLHKAKNTHGDLSPTQEAEFSNLINLASQYPNALITRTVTASLLGLSIKSLEAWASNGSRNLPYQKCSRSVRYRLGDIKAYMDANTRTHTL